MTSAPPPEINGLRPESSPSLDKITLLSNKGARPEETKTVPASGGAVLPKERQRPRRRKKDTPSYLQVEEIERLFKVIASARDRAIFRLAYHAGLRASEVGMLEMRDFNPRTERVFVSRLKGSNSGEHHLCREESRSLRAWLKVRGTAPGVIFTSNRRSAISRKMLDVLMKQYGKRAGDPRKAAALSRAQALVRDAPAFQGVPCRAGAGLDRACQYPKHDDLRARDERPAG
jgi:integrase